MVNTTLPDACLEPLPEDAEQPKIIIHVAMGMVALLSVCGIMGNALVIFVFSRQKHKLSSTVFILTLAVTDFISSLVTMPYTVVIELMDYDIGYDIPCKLYQFMKTTTIPFSAFVMVAIALDRYLCIVYPFKHIMTIKRAKLTVAMLALLAFVIGIMCSLMIGTYRVAQPKTSECVINDDKNKSNSTVLRYAGESRANLSMSYIDIVSENDGGTSVQTPNQPEKPGDIIHVGICGLTTVILSKQFIFTYQKIYSSLFGICAVAVVILYCLTYKSVLAHRRKRLNITYKCCGILSKGEQDESTAEHTEFTTLHQDNVINGNGSESIRLQDKYAEHTDTESPAKVPGTQCHRKSEYDTHPRPGGVSRAKLKKLRVANIKTALMLSIVACLFIVAFTPAWMMALHVLPMNVIVYYLYFTYNVANPVIYAFLNNSFRTHLQVMFRCKA